MKKAFFAEIVNYLKYMKSELLRIKEKLVVYSRNSVFLRFLVYPLMLMTKHNECKQFRTLPDSRIISSYKDSHAGERCFIVGNGPSLTIGDLNKLKEEITFGSNGIYHAFDKTDWRPSFYMSIDNSYLDSQINNIKKYVKGRKFLNYCCSHYGRCPEDEIVYFLMKGPFKFNRGNYYQTEISENVADHFTQSFSVTATSMEFALYMGFKEIYLIGVDHDYSYTDDGRQHFYKDPGGFNVNIFREKNLTKTYELYRTYAESHGIKIYNATRGGKLEVFPRINLDEVTQDKHDCKVNQK